MNGGTSFGDLLVRTIVSLGVVLALVAVAYVVAKRRGRSGLNRSGTGRAGSARAGGARWTGRRSAPAGVEVVGRAGLSRSTAAVAVRFGDRVVLVTTSEQGPTSTLAEMPAERWDELMTVRDPIADLGSAGCTADRSRSGGSTAGQGTPFRAPMGFVEALRQATARHA